MMRIGFTQLSLLTLMADTSVSSASALTVAAEGSAPPPKKRPQERTPSVVDGACVGIGIVPRYEYRLKLKYRVFALPIPRFDGYG